MAEQAFPIATRMRAGGLALVLLGLSACARSDDAAVRLQEGPFSHRFDGVSKVDSADDAVGRVIALKPQLHGFATQALPPATVETARAPEGGWYVGFIQRGSGRLGIIEARCFEVHSDRVVFIAEFHATFGQSDDQIKLATCRP